jgi:hypothetical protein
MFNIKSIMFFLVTILNALVMSLSAEGEKPQLILHFDVNRTLFMLDPASNKTAEDCILHTLADTYEDCWDNHVLEPISYTDYIKEYIYPGIEAGNLELKRTRKEKISQFLTYLEMTNHRFSKKANEDFKLASENLKNHSTLILKAFYKLISYLQYNEYHYSIVLRTFGMDLDVVIEDIEKQTFAGFFETKAEFKDGILNFEKPDNHPSISNLKEVYTYLKSHGHVAIHDDWLPWSKSGELQIHGKPFPIDLDDTKVISLFFDDNISTKMNSVKNIVSPIDIKTGKSLSVYELIQKHRLFAVNSIEAILDDTYFIRLVESSL